LERLASAVLIAASLFGGLWLGVALSAMAQEPAWNMAGHTISGVRVARPFWRRGSGLAYASMTLINNNPYPVWQVIVACDFFDQWGNNIGTKATAIARVFSPGRTRITGIYFTTTTPKFQWWSLSGADGSAVEGVLGRRPSESGEMCDPVMYPLSVSGNHPPAHSFNGGKTPMSSPRLRDRPLSLRPELTQRHRPPAQ
jgi:hypothetical protein